MSLGKAAASGIRTPLLTAFETTYLPGHGVDVAQTSGHDRMWQADLERVLDGGVRVLRYPLRWHRIERHRGWYDWSEPDAVLGWAAERGVELVVDLLHHTSYPEWLDDGFRDRRFGAAFVAYAEAAAVRYPWLTSYTLFNEPFATLFLAGHEALWPPYDRGIDGFVRLLRSVMPALAAASRCWSELLPDAAHLWVDTCEHHSGTPGTPAAYAALANDRRHVVLDLALRHDLDPQRPFLHCLLEAGGEALLDLEPVRVDVLGLDYYCHSEWFYDEAGGHAPSPRPVGLAALLEQYAGRYALPVVVSETNVRGLPSDRASWLRYVLEQCEAAAAHGVNLQGLCWFPYVDSCDWDSLLARPAGRADPVGVVGLDRARTLFTEAWEAAAAGATSQALPAYRFQPPCDRQLAGFLPLLAHWPWQDPPSEQTVPVLGPHSAGGLVSQTVPDLVVLSHLRWPWVWQRPQHLISRMARDRAAGGARTWFVEEPVTAEVAEPCLAHEDREGITRVWLEVPASERPAELDSFGATGAEQYGQMLRSLFVAHARPPAPDVWLYTPMALDIAEELEPGRLVYDVMDDLASFRNAPQSLVLNHRRTLAEADVVFAGGRSLHRAVVARGRADAHLFPSGVETSHYERSRALRRPRPNRVAGYVGVIDERLDLPLLADLAARLPAWTIRLVGPVAKIDPATLPQAANIELQGFTPYERLPEVMAGFDVALMPFAINEATRSISPTKTLEYLAAGLPVVSTRVPDVVADYATVVHLADDGAGFAEACLEVVEHSVAERDRRLQPVQARLEWDRIAARMARLIDLTARAERVREESA